MQIQDVPSQFQPKYTSNYPPYSSGKNIEEIIFDHLIKEKDNIETDYIYLPVFWTSYYIINDYNTTGELLRWMDSLDKSKTYFTIVQYDSGIYVNNHTKETKDLNIITFSAGGGGLNTAESIREYEFHGLRRMFFNGTKGDYMIPLICLPQLPNMNLERDIYCSFMGRFDTYFSRTDMKHTLENSANKDKFKLFETVNYEEYKQIINRSIFTLAPRGFGFTSFRLYEAIYANSIPIYIWDNEIALPFSDKIDWNEFCVIIHSSKINQIEEILEKVNIPEMQKKLEEIKSVFTFEYTTDYIIRKISNTNKDTHTTNEKKISLGITHYNNTEYIVDAIKPALLDDRISEIIICDDVSTDINTLEHIIKELGNPKIKLYKNQKNLGCYHNKLETISKCSNQWTMLLDSDNIISKEFIDRLYELPEWNTNTIYAPSHAETFPIEPSDLLNFAAFANQYITNEIYIKNALPNLNFICLINNCNYFLPTQEYINCMNKYTYERATIDSLDSNVLFTDWLYNNNTVFIVENLKYKHRLHPKSNYNLSHTCDEPTIRRMLVDKLLSLYENK
jgi:hypothetical protein